MSRVKYRTTPRGYAVLFTAAILLPCIVNLTFWFWSTP